MMLRFFAIALLLPLARGLSPRRLHVAAWQGAAKTADVAANVARVVDEAAAAAAAGVDVLVFPELFLHGYDATKDQLEATALRRDDLGACAAAAEAHELCLAVPYCERRGSSLYNAMAVFDARGALARNYRKVNLWGAWERDVFAPGAPGSFEPFDLETRSLTVRAGCLICFDVEFPEPARQLAVAGAELLLAPTALGAGPVDDLTPRKVIPTRALENHVTVVYANLEGLAAAGDRGVAAFCGCSAVVDPAGADLARAGTFVGGRRVGAVVDLDAYASDVARNPYLADRAQRAGEGHYAALRYPRASLATRVGRRVAGARRAVAARLVAGRRDAPTDASSDPGGAPDAASRREATRVSAFVAGLAPKTLRYGDDPAQLVDVYAAPGGANATIAVVHGGFWKRKWDRGSTQTTSLVPFFLDRGFDVALIEYRPRDVATWPGPEDDVAAALDLLAETREIAVVVGHSAGATLAVQACERSGKARACVAVAPVPDMAAGFASKLSDEGDAVARYLGGAPRDEPEAYAAASLPATLTTPTLLVSCARDADVPPDLVEAYDPAGPATRLRVECDHYACVTADDDAWREVWRAAQALLVDEAGAWTPPAPADYGVSLDRGFLPAEDPLGLLPAGAAFDAWEAAVDALPGLLAAKNVRSTIAALPPPPPGWVDALDARAKERAYGLLSFLGHAAVWGEEPFLTSLPANLAVPWCAAADALKRPPVLTYASFNLHNWRRLDPDGPVALGNTARRWNFLGGQDEEWFSAVHVAIEAAGGKAVYAAADAQRLAAAGPFDAAARRGAAAALADAAAAIRACVAVLERMGERCDPYIYHQRVRVFMQGWTADGMPEAGLAYEGAGRSETFFGETGAQSSLVPALDAALGIGMSEDDLLPYLLAMRDYMPAEHAAFVRHLEAGPRLRDAVVAAGDGALVAAYDDAVAALVVFRKLHFELAYTYVRQWDSRPDDDIKGTGGTPFMPYLKKHRRTTYETLIAPAAPEE